MRVVEVFTCVYKDLVQPSNFISSIRHSVGGPYFEAYKGTTNINNATRTDEPPSNSDCDISTRVGPNAFLLPAYTSQYGGRRTPSSIWCAKLCSGKSLVILGDDPSSWV